MSLLLTYALRNSASITGHSRKDIFAALFGDDSILDNKAEHTKNYFKTRTIEITEPELFAIPLQLLDDLRQLPHTKEYTEFNIPKHSGGYRTINAPNRQLKYIQRTVADWLRQDCRLLMHNSAYAYCPGRSAYDALVVHQHNKSRWFLKVDIKDFFHSITTDVLKRMLPQIYPLNFLSEEYLDWIIDIATLDGELPQGSPLSPILSNLVMLAFDKKITHALYDYNDKRYTYTRYADDLLISCRINFEYADVIRLIEDTLSSTELPLQIKHSKTRYGNANGRNWNLGLMYNQDLQITIGTKKKRRLHATLHTFLLTIGTGDEFSIEATRELIGQLSYLKSIEPMYYTNMMKKYQRKFNVWPPTALKERVSVTVLQVGDTNQQEQPWAPYGVDDPDDLF